MAVEDVSGSGNMGTCYKPEKVSGAMVGQISNLQGILKMT